MFTVPKISYSRSGLVRASTIGEVGPCPTELYADTVRAYRVLGLRSRKVKSIELSITDTEIKLDACEWLSEGSTDTFMCRNPEEPSSCI